MERPATPPPKSAPAPPPRTPPTPEVTRRIEENRLKAKALRERSLAAQAAQDSSSSHAGQKRTHAAISTANVPSTSRDARQKDKDDAIQPARNFKKYVDHDFSKMTDTKGGFLAAEDDPFNKVLHAPAMEVERPAHMTLKEWERHQTLKALRQRKEGPYEPGIGLGKEGVKCRECASPELDWQWLDVFKVGICGKCKEKLPEKYSLLTKTEAKDDYLLTDPELKDPELLPHLSKPNPHKSHWHDMNLFLRFQVEEYAFSERKWGSPEALDAEFERREGEKKERKEKKFRTKLKELKKKTRTDAYRRNGVKGGVGSEKHEHEWGRTVENADGMTVKTCTECGMEVEELEF